MQQALDLAQKGVGQCAPNPAVGCIIVKDEKVIAQARTANGGRPHAESQALQLAGKAAKGATLYVTLEPCAHHGQTPPCAQTIINAGIAKVVIACRDPYPKVNGGGIAMLKQAGIEVVEAICKTEAIAANCGFLSRVKRLRPWVTVKVATTADHFIAHEDGSSKWITGEASRNHVHLLRARNDAILTGSGTYLTDKPQLNVRVEGLEHCAPKRYLLDRSSQVTQSDFTLCRHDSLKQLLEEMGSDGINYLMVEAGAKLSASFLSENLIDELHWYKAPHVKFRKGIEVFDGLWDGAVKPAIAYSQEIDNDLLTVYHFTQPQSLINS